MDSLKVEVMDDLILFEPTNMVVNPFTGQLLLCEYSEHCIVQINPLKMDSFKVVAGIRRNFGSDYRSATYLTHPQCIAFSPPSFLYVAESGHHCIKKFDLSQSPSPSMEIIAGTGLMQKDKQHLHSDEYATSCPLRYPEWITLNYDHSIMAICESTSHRISILSLSSRKFLASFLIDFDTPHALLFSMGHTDRLYISTSYGIEEIETDYPSISKWPRSGPIGASHCQLLCGERDDTGYRDGYRLRALFDNVIGMLMNDDENIIFMSEFRNRCIRMLDLETDMVTTIAGNGKPAITGGPALQSSFRSPHGLCWINDGDILVANSVPGGTLSVLKGVGNSNISSQNHLPQSISNMRFFTSIS